MNTTHHLYTGNSNDLHCIPDNSVQLIVTSPPYPMIEMWDEIFSLQDQTILDDFANNNPSDAFEKMHLLLDDVWKECDRVLVDNGFVCINIGDATRTFDGAFALYPNHSRVIQSFHKMGYTVLPDIHWRKQSNAPNKFMGSGMYPAGAYVTYEHEYILVFRKGSKRTFTGDAKVARQESAYFWEERNIWFSDLWEIKGITQKIKSSSSDRSRNASFPLEIPYRLVNMYSVKGDTVLDPFCGLGTTTLACMASERNSIGIDISDSIIELATHNIEQLSCELNTIIDARISAHESFIDNLTDEKKEKCYTNGPHGFFVKTRQETALRINKITDISRNSNQFICVYE